VQLDDIAAMLILGVGVAGLRDVGTRRGWAARRLLLALGIGTVAALLVLVLEPGTGRWVALVLMLLGAGPYAALIVAARLGPTRHHATLRALVRVFPGLLDPEQTRRLQAADRGLDGAREHARQDGSRDANAQLLAAAVAARAHDDADAALQALGGPTRLTGWELVPATLHVARTGSSEDMARLAEHVLALPGTGQWRTQVVALLLVHLGAPEAAARASARLHGIAPQARAPLAELYRGIALLRRGDTAGREHLESIPSWAGQGVRASAAAHLADPPPVFPRELAEPLIPRLAADRSLEAPPPPRLLQALTALLVAVYAAQAWIGTDALGLVRAGAAFTPLTPYEPWRLVTAMLLHASLLHLAVNLAALWMFGRTVVGAHGASRAIVALVVGGIGAGLASYAWHDVAIGVGASGAAMAWIALVVQRQGRNALASVATIVALELTIGATTAGIDNAAHLGGLAAGLLLAVVWRRPPGRTSSVAAAVATGVVLLCMGRAALWAPTQLPLHEVRVGEWVVDAPLGFDASGDWVQSQWSRASVNLPPVHPEPVDDLAALLDELRDAVADGEVATVGPPEPWREGLRQRLHVDSPYGPMDLVLHVTPMGHGTAILFAWTDDPSWSDTVDAIVDSVRRAPSE
jgi:membrane associated rhomboid family serine protease